MGAGGCGVDVIRPRRPLTALDSQGKRIFTLRDVEKHNKPDDCWIIIKNKVYDVTMFAKEHPGGAVIYTYAGRDATDVFSVFHASSTWSLLPGLVIGDFVSEENVPDVVKDFRELRQRLIHKRLFESNKLYYVFKFLCNMGIVASSVFLLYTSQSWASVSVSALLMALSFQQNGWLAHDFLHHQVFKARVFNDLIGGVVLGNLCQGFSAAWWKDKHNKHHAVTNECDEKYNAVDPDIDTLPLLAWSKGMIQTVESKTLRSILRWQSYFLIPMLFLARFSWLISSAIYAMTTEMPFQKKIVERGTLAIHFAALFSLAFGFLPTSMACFWLILSQVFGGVFLGIVFVQSHNGKEVYNEFKDFFTSQIISTRDVKGGLFNDWFTGGLNRQIEHHLFPTMPRHNLGIVAKEVNALCKKHGLNYEDVSIIEGTKLVLQCLAEVASVA